MYAKSFFFLFFVLFSLTFAYENGAPKESCDTMMPEHDNAKPDMSAAPYNFHINKKVVKKGERVDITISGKTPTDRIKGFLLQARSGNERVGHFVVDPSNPFVQPLDCGDVPASAVTHKKHEGVGSFTVTWVAPENTSEEIKFLATIVLNKGKFWTGVASDQVKVEE